MLQLLRRAYYSLTRTRPCKNTAELIAYIPPGSLRHLARWIARRIERTPDRLQSDEWLAPDETIRRGRGDSEDMAVLAYTVVASWTNWGARIMTLAWKEAEGRAGTWAVCTFEDPAGRKGFIDGGRVKFVRGSWQDVAKAVTARPVIRARWTTMAGLPAGTVIEAGEEHGDLIIPDDPS